ncbi:MAG TPA: peptidoglycan-binding domain-containing protein, partial [Gaiellaceae bacterium]|nr:peptidoglycan-binding domain-containing protein [Gaiellaceae bacterium]
MRRFAVVGVALLLGVLGLAPESFAGNARVAALQVALRAHGFDPGPIDGVRGPATSGALLRFQRAKGLASDGKVGPATRRAFGARGRPLLG